MHSLFTRLPERVVLDGAVGTELIALGLRVGVECPESWNELRPADVRALHEAYFTAGADAVQTNTFGGTEPRLAQYGRGKDVRAWNVAAAHLAREVRPTGKWVIGSMGPTGDCAEDRFAEQAMALAEGGVDLLCLETMCDPVQAREALRGARKGAPGLAVVAEMTCLREASGYVTPLGSTAEAMLQVFLDEGADGIGANCSLLPTEMAPLVHCLARTGLPVFAKPITGQPGEALLSPSDFAVGTLALFAAGARAVGGCCGTGPAHIAALRRAL